MTNYAYNEDIPDGPNNPSADQPKMKTNTNSTKTLIGEDHITFEANNGGLHKWARLVNTTTTPPITGMLTTCGGLYTRTIRSANQLLFADGQTGIEYQLTSISNPNSASFATNTQYDLPTNTYVGGWTFLPGVFVPGGPPPFNVDGGMLLQYGLVTDTTGLVSNGNGSVVFPRNYNNPAYSVQITPIRNQSNVNVIYVVSVANNGFVYRNTSGSGITGF